MTLETWKASHGGWTQGPWPVARREAALARFAEVGFPAAKAEDWKYTSTRAIAKTPFVHGESDIDVSAALDAVRLPEAAAEIVLVNGVLRPDLSRMTAPEGVELLPLSEALDSDEVREGVGALAGDDAFASLNEAFLQDGLLVRAVKNADVQGVIHLVHVTVSDGAPIVAHPRHIVQVERGARLTLAETGLALGDAETLTNQVVEIRVGDNASLTHVVTANRNPQGMRVSRVVADVSRDGRYHHHAAWLGGGLIRNEVVARLTGPGAHVQLDGLYVLGDRDHVDNHTVLDHVAPHCTSKELYKGVLGGRAKGVFDGLIIVQKDAQQTDASQQNRNLLLTDTADANAKPQLEIYADDVKCAHGTTVGQLDKAQLEYLRMRGIPVDKARQVLTSAFVDEVVDRVPIESLRDRLRERVAERLATVWEDAP